MKLIIPALLFVFTFSFMGAKAQQTHFIYIQTNDKQSFYVKLNDKVYSSAASGYVILSKLIDSTYNLVIGFPKTELPQQNLSCTINKKDLGFILKDFGDKGWGLLNLQTSDITMANSASSENNTIKEERTDSFSNMLSAVVNDPIIKQDIIVKKEVKDTSQSIQNTEPAGIETVSKEIPASMPITVKSTITKMMQKINQGGTELIYLDNNNSSQDTIRMFIPADKIDVSVQQPDSQQIEEKRIIAEATAEDPVKIDIPVKAVKVTSDSIINQTNSKPIAEKPEIQKTVDTTRENIIIANSTTNINCKNFASEDDFLKLRKKMVSEKDDDNMVSTAKKVFKQKCFKTDQIKNLGFLFLDDAGRYHFFDMAYAFVSDPENFSLLQSQLTDQYYVNRFKVMINN
jgi:hypothetical protein